MPARPRVPLAGLIALAGSVVAHRPARADVDGRFAPPLTPEPVADPALRVRVVRVDHPDCVPRAGRVEPPAPLVEAFRLMPDLGEIRLEPGTVVRGRPLDGDGRPLDGRGLVALGRSNRFERGTMDAEGHFAFAPLRPGNSLIYGARRGMYGGIDPSRPLMPANATVVLVDSAGKPAWGVFVTLAGSLPSEEGKAELAGVELPSSAPASALGARSAIRTVTSRGSRRSSGGSVPTGWRRSAWPSRRTPPPPPAGSSRPTSSPGRRPSSATRGPTRRSSTSAAPAPPTRS